MLFQEKPGPLGLRQSSIPGCSPLALVARREFGQKKESQPRGFSHLGFAEQVYQRQLNSTGTGHKVLRALVFLTSLVLYIKTGDQTAFLWHNVGD